MTLPEFEKRLSALESELALLKAGLGALKRHPVHALEQIHGTFEDDGSCEEAARLGRQWSEQIEIGWQQTERGELVDGPSVFAEIRKKSRKKRRATQAKR